MIGKLKGILSEVHGEHALIETTSGVYYKVMLPPKLLAQEGHIQNIELYTYLVVKEDELSLYGFETYDDYRLFELFISVDGVGPKTAFLIVSTTQSDDIKAAVFSSDVAFFQKIKGIGKKTAQRILVDLSSKMGTEFDLKATMDTNIDKDSIEALKALGFKHDEALEALKDIDPKLDIEEKIRLALRKMS